MNLKRSLGLISLLLILTVTFSACSSSDEELKTGDGEAALEVEVQPTSIQSNLLQSVTGNLMDKVAINKLELMVYQANEYQSEGSNAEVVDSVTKEITGLDNLESQAFYVPNGQSYVIAAQLSGTIDGEAESNIYRGVSEPTGVLEDATTSPVTVNVSFEPAEQLEVVIDGIPQQVGDKDVAQMNVELSNPALGTAVKTITEARTVSFNNDDLELRPAVVQLDIQLQDSKGADIPAGGEFGGEIQLLPGQKQQLSVDQQPYLEVDSTSVEVDETGTLTFMVVGADPEGAEVSLEVVSETKPSGVNFNGETGEFSWQPDEDDQGTYQVKFRAQAGSQSNYEVVTIQVNDKLDISVNRSTSPNVPTLIDASYDDSAVSLTIDGATGNANYIVYRNTVDDSAGAEPVSDGLVDVTSWSDSSVENGNVYYYWVKEYSADGLSSALSSSVELDIESPNWITAPYITITPDTSSVGVIVEVDEAGTIYYKVMSHGTSTPTASEVKLAGNNISISADTEQEITVDSLDAGTDYDIFFVAEDNVGNLQHDGLVETVNVSTATDGPEMITVSAGTAADGSTAINNDIEMGKYEVTQAEFNSVMGFNPSDFSGSNLPVEQVTWYDAVMYCNKLSEVEGLDKYYNISGITYEGTEGASNITDATVTENTSANGYRLPTETEWEYATCGGTNGNSTTYAGSNNIDDVAWYDGNAGEETNPVGEKQANELDIYDMSGNVWEWTNTPDGSKRVMRGGSWGNGAYYCKVVSRYNSNPSSSRNNLGFRLRKTK